jgi:hypothetical protein
VGHSSESPRGHAPAPRRPAPSGRRRRRPWLRTDHPACLPSGTPRGRASESPRVAPLPWPPADSPAAPRPSPGGSPSSELPRGPSLRASARQPPSARVPGRRRFRPRLSARLPAGPPSESPSEGASESPHVAHPWPPAASPATPRWYPGEPLRPSRHPSGRPDLRARSSESPPARRPSPAVPARPRPRKPCVAARALWRPARCARAASARAVAIGRARPRCTRTLFIGAATLGWVLRRSQVYALHSLSVLPRSGGSYAAPRRVLT